MKPLLAALFTLSLHAQELTFLEKFATPTTRTEALQALTPLTRDWFYYHALDQQLRGDEAAFTATMQEWKRQSEHPKSAVSTQGFSVLENRQLLLRGKFNFRDHSSIASTVVIEFAVLLNHASQGTCIEKIVP